MSSLIFVFFICFCLFCFCQLKQHGLYSISQLTQMSYFPHTKHLFPTLSSGPSPAFKALPLSSPDEPRKDLSDIHLTNCLIAQQADWCEWKHDLSQGGSLQRSSGTLIRTDKSPRKRILHTHTETYLQVHWSAMIKPWEDKGEQWSGKQAPLGLFYSYLGDRESSIVS